MPFREKDEQSQESDQREEDYKKLYPKIGRDFISIEDFEAFVEGLSRFIPGFNLTISNSKAVSLATEYKQQLDGEIKPKKYTDLVELDEESDKEKEEESEKEKGLLD